MKETDEQSRLRRYLAAYERLCKKYSLMVYDGFVGHSTEVSERLTPSGFDDLPRQIDKLKEGGINT